MRDGNDNGEIDLELTGFVVSLPMRDGNQRVSASAVRMAYVVSLPMRDGNLFPCFSISEASLLLAYL